MWKERITPPIRSLAGAMVLLAALLAAVVHFGAGPADAQPATSAAAAVQYALVPVDQIVPHDAGVGIEEMIPFGKDNVYLVATTTSLIVFRVDVNGSAAANVRIGEIPLTADRYDEIVVLDDKASFLVRNRTGIAVWSVTRSEIVPVRQRGTPSPSDFSGPALGPLTWRPAGPKAFPPWPFRSNPQRKNSKTA